MSRNKGKFSIRSMFILRSLITFAIILIFALIIYADSGGITGLTKRGPAPGCTCHGADPDTSVKVAINGPDILAPGQTANYTLTIKGGPLAAGGTDIAVSGGSLVPASGSDLQLLNGELTHKHPETPVSDVVTFQFTYTAPTAAGEQITIYANGNSVNLDGTPNGDKWNFAPNKTIAIGAKPEVRTSPPWILQRAAGIPQSADPQLIFSAVDKNICWGCNYTNSQFLRTTDGGTTWRVNTVGNGLVCSSISALDSSTAWVAVNNPGGILKTTDGGRTWIKDTAAFIKTGGNPNAIHFFDNDNGVCVGNPNGGDWEIYTTSNGGANWVRVNSANIPVPDSGELGGVSGEVPLVPSIAGNNFCFATYSGSLYKTTDRGITWTVTRNVLNGYPFSIAFKDSLNGVACSPNIKAISITSDGGNTWEPVNVAFNSPSPFTVAYVKGTDNGYLISAFVHADSGENLNPGTAYSGDGGRTWEVINNLPNLFGDFASDGTGWSAGVSDSIYKWIPFFDKIVPTAAYIDKITARKNVDSVLFITTFLNPNNSKFKADLIYTNLEHTFVDSVNLYDDGLHGDLNSNDGIYGAYIPPISIEDFFQLNISTTADSTNEYVNTPILQYGFTTAGPVKFDSLSISKISSNIYNVKPLFKNTGSSYMIQNLAVKISSSNKLIISQIIPDSIYIPSIAPGALGGPTNGIDVTVGSRFAGLFTLNFEIMSNGQTFWADTISQEATGIEDNNRIPLSFNLSQNYPNPFNPSTKISYSIPEQALVTLKVFDILGKEVRALVNEEKRAGTYEINFKTSNLSSGIYFYQLRAGSFVETKKMVLLK